MSKINIDIPKEELCKTPVMSNGTVVTFNINKVEKKPTKNKEREGAEILALSCVVIKADDQKNLGIEVYHNICIPHESYRGSKGFSLIINGWVRLCEIFGFKDPSNVDETDFFNKKFQAVAGTQEYPKGSGKIINEIADILRMV